MKFLLITSIFFYVIAAFAIWSSIKLSSMVADWRKTDEAKKVLAEAKILYPDMPNLVVYPSGHADARQKITGVLAISLLLGSLFMAFYLFG